MHSYKSQSDIMGFLADTCKLLVGWLWLYILFVFGLLRQFLGNDVE